MQREYSAFMSKADNRTFGQVCKNALIDSNKNFTAFETVKEIVNNEFSKRVIRKHKGAIALIALSILIGKTKHRIYDILEGSEISSQIEKGNYFTF